MPMPRQRQAAPSGPRFEPLEPRRFLAADPITYVDGDGSTVTIKLSGNGDMDLVADGGSFDLNITGADQGTKLSISVKGGDGRTTLDDIDVAGALKSINAKTVDLLGDLTVTGSATQIALGNLLASGQHTVSLGGTEDAKPVKIDFGIVNDLTLVCGTEIKQLQVEDWLDSGSNDSITCPSLLKLTSKAGLETDITLVADDENDARLGKVTVKDMVDGVWFVDGKMDKIKIGSSADSFTASAFDTISSVQTTGDLSGTWAAAKIGKVKVGGDVVDAAILGGADLGDDAQLGGAGANTDLFFKGTVSSLKVKGMMTDSVVSAGLDPDNGVFGDGDDFVIGKGKSSFGSISVKGIADPDTLFAAGKFSKVKIAGTKVDPPGDPRFLLASTDADLDPPVITAALLNDTGTPGDSITSDPTIVGRVTDLGNVTALRVGIDDDELDDFAHITKLVEDNGTFELLRSDLEDIFDGPLGLGAHTVNLFARDDSGNSAAIFTVAFVLVV